MDGFVDILLRRRFRTSKFKNIIKLAISRVEILKKHSQVRYSNAKSDAIQLLILCHTQRALLRVEHMIKEQNMMDVLVMVQEYCSLLIDRIIMLKKDRECDDEMREAISSLIFASSRCGEFPELREIRDIFMSRFGKEFVSQATELRNNCRVNPKMIQKLSTKQPSLENRMEVLKEIAHENGITLDSVEDAAFPTEEKLDEREKPKLVKWYSSGIEHDDDVSVPKNIESNANEKMSESLKNRREYRDVADAALEAFQAAAYAAVAARAAVELSTSKSLETDNDHHTHFSDKNGGVL